MSTTVGRASVKPPSFDPPTRRPRLKPRWGRIALLAGLAVLIIAVIAGISLYGYANGLDKDLKRTNAFSGLTGDRPAKAVDGALNILLVGSDSRDPDAKEDQANAWRADTLILMHVPADHKSAQLVGEYPSALGLNSMPIWSAPMPMAYWSSRLN